ncbi:unnamed protein product [Cuscuta epithymum]|uniref:Uncharacterized protein n=1 Tax=Cuscuta epithymum TaxID=186058 RepID=A0AAV0FBQ0_9ASTE|nr:unnamed protein product [Cuscuta epithymum]CAH9132921.1 unnamed protein product [Cuscuta epithymum]
MQMNTTIGELLSLKLIFSLRIENMAFAATRWRSLINATVAPRRQFASSTAPKFAPEVVGSATGKAKSWLASGDAMPLWMMAGFVSVVLFMGVHTAKNQLIHSPSVQVKKKKRENLVEVDDPKTVVGSADKFVNKSFLRKVGQIQDPETRVLKDPNRRDPFTIPRKYESLDFAGAHK